MVRSSREGSPKIFAVPGFRPGQVQRRAELRWTLLPARRVDQITGSESTVPPNLRRDPLRLYSPRHGAKRLERGARAPAGPDGTDALRLRVPRGSSRVVHLLRRRLPMRRLLPLRREVDPCPAPTGCDPCGRASAVRSPELASRPCAVHGGAGADSVRAGDVVRDAPHSGDGWAAHPAPQACPEDLGELAAPPLRADSIA